MKDRMALSKVLGSCSGLDGEGLRRCLVTRLLLKVPHDHSTSFLESKSLVESLDHLVTDQVNHVEIFEFLNHASDQLRSDAFPLPFRQHLKMWDIGARNTVRYSADEANHLLFRKDCNNHVVASL